MNLSVRLSYWMLLLLVTWTIKLSHAKDKKKCQNSKSKCLKLQSKEVVKYLSSKAPYSYETSSTTQFVPDGCNAVKFWYFGRHGTRNPGKKDVINMQTHLLRIRDEILNSHQNCQGSLCKKQLKKMISWKLHPRMNLEKSKHLAKQGKNELNSIALRYQERFPQLFSSPFDNKTYHFRFTQSQRTKASARAFTQAIFGPEDYQQPKVSFAQPPPTNSDPLLKFYETCPKWIEEVDKNPRAKTEHAKFITSSIMNETIRKISERLGLERTLSLQETTTIYTTCGFETAWKNGKLSPWCSAFDYQALQLMAYAEDLEYFWVDGYGYETNYKQACPPIHDVVQYFQRYISGAHNLKVQAYFSHSGATLKILARLGLFNDSIPIKSDNFQEVKNTYKWRTSLIDTMATNLAFVLYNCPTQPSRYQVGFFFQERPTSLRACDGQWHCPFEKFANNLASITNHCNLKQICNVALT